jgi:hypothetical protein
MSKTPNRFERAWAEVVAKVWYEGDQGFRERLLRDPKSVFAELGASIPADVTLTVVENTRQQITFVVPPKPEELSGLRDEAMSELYRACPGTVCAACSTQPGRD